MGMTSTLNATDRAQPALKRKISRSAKGRVKKALRKASENENWE
jgi:hypothetical protein